MSSSKQKMNIDSQESNIEQLLQTGFETIVQAFELKNTTYQASLKEQATQLNELQSKITILKEEIEILKQENSFYKKENEQLRLANMKLNSSLRNSQNRLKTIRNSINEEKDYINYCNTNANESNNTNFIDGESALNNDNEMPLTERRDVQKKIKVNNTRPKTKSVNNLYKHPYGHLTSNNSTSNIYANKNELKGKYGHIETRIHSLKKNLTNRTEPIIANTSLNDKYNSTYQMKYSNNNMNSTTPRFNPIDFTAIKDSSNRRSQSMSRPEYNKEEYDYGQKENSMNNPNDINNNVSIESNISNQSKQYEVTNQFLNQCKIYLTPGNFERIVNTFQDYKDGLINDDEIVSRTRSILQGNNKLLNLFETLFLLE